MCLLPTKNTHHPHDDGQWKEEYKETQTHPENVLTHTHTHTHLFGLIHSLSSFVCRLLALRTNYKLPHTVNYCTSHSKLRVTGFVHSNCYREPLCLYNRAIATVKRANQCFWLKRAPGDRLFMNAVCGRRVVRENWARERGGEKKSRKERVQTTHNKVVK